MTATQTGIASIAIDAEEGSIAWLNAFLATAQDEARPALYRTLSVEFFANGVQFIATDGTMLFRTWSPASNAIVTDWPTLDEAPDVSVVVMDSDKFASTFMNTLRVAIGEFATELLITVDREESAQPSLTDELTPNVLTLSAFGQHLHCRVLDQPYPNWRQLRFGLDPAEVVDGMKLAKRLFATVGKLRGVSGVDLTFHGGERRIDFVAEGIRQVRGCLMPMRRDGKQTEDEDEK